MRQPTKLHVSAGLAMLIGLCSGATQAYQGLSDRTEAFVSTLRGESAEELGRLDLESRDLILVSKGAATGSSLNQERPVGESEIETGQGKLLRAPHRNSGVRTGDTVDDGQAETHETTDSSSQTWPLFQFKIPTLQQESPHFETLDIKNCGDTSVDLNLEIRNASDARVGRSQLRLESGKFVRATVVKLTRADAESTPRPSITSARWIKVNPERIDERGIHAVVDLRFDSDSNQGSSCAEFTSPPIRVKCTELGCVEDPDFTGVATKDPT